MKLRGTSANANVPATTAVFEGRMRRASKKNATTDNEVYSSGNRRNRSTRLNGVTLSSSPATYNPSGEYVNGSDAEL